MSIEPVSITAKAIEEIKHMMTRKGIPEDYALRIGIQGGGCGAMGYRLGFDRMNESDVTYTYESIPVVIEKKHVMYLMGMKIDFFEDAEERGFFFHQPKGT